SPGGDPVPEMRVICSQITATDAYITGPTEFTTNMSGLISTTVFGASTYDQEIQIECRIKDSPNYAVFNLETAFVVDRLEWVPGFEPAGTYTASNTVAMNLFQIRMIDTDNQFIDVTNTKNWI